MKTTISTVSDSNDLVQNGGKGDDIVSHSCGVRDGVFCISKYL